MKRNYISTRRCYLNTAMVLLAVLLAVPLAVPLAAHAQPAKPQDPADTTRPVAKGAVAKPVSPEVLEVIKALEATVEAIKSGSYTAYANERSNTEDWLSDLFNSETQSDQIQLKAVQDALTERARTQPGVAFDHAMQALFYDVLYSWFYGWFDQYEDDKRKPFRQQVVEHSQKILQVEPHSALGHHLLAAGLLNNGDVKQREHHLREAVRLAPTNAIYHRRLADDLQDALKLYGKSLACFSTDIAPEKISSEFRYHSRRAGEIDPELALSVIAEGDEAMKTDQANEVARADAYVDAACAYRSAVLYAPSNAEYRFKLAQALKKMDCPQEALFEAREALRLGHTSVTQIFPELKQPTQIATSPSSAETAKTQPKPQPAPARASPSPPQPPAPQPSPQPQSVAEEKKEPTLEDTLRWIQSKFPMEHRGKSDDGCKISFIERMEARVEGKYTLIFTRQVDSRRDCFPEIYSSTTFLKWVITVPLGMVRSDVVANEHGLFIGSDKNVIRVQHHLREVPSDSRERTVDEKKDQRESLVTIFLKSDLEMKERIANALNHAIKLSQGKEDKKETGEIF